MKKSITLLSGVSAVALAYAANAETVSPSIQSILSAMNAAGGSETLQQQVAPSYSELFGLGVRATVGGYVNEDFALGVIIDYAEHREEYLANAGFRLNENMRVIGSVGILKESEEFTLGDGRQDVEQMEYGLSLKGDYEAGIVRGFEINSYHTDASSDTDTVETGDLTGFQLVTNLKPSDAADIRLGAGWERAEWDGGDVDEGYTLQALGSLKATDKLSLNFAAKSAETENTYGLGMTYDMSTPDVQNSSLSISFNEIEGKHGISDDTRVAINWTVGFGAAASAGASDVTASSMGGMPSLARKDLLAEVMTRPAFLPERVLAREKETVGPLECREVAPAPGVYQMSYGIYAAAQSPDVAPNIELHVISRGNTPLPDTVTLTAPNESVFELTANRNIQFPYEVVYKYVDPNAAVGGLSDLIRNAFGSVTPDQKFTLDMGPCIILEQVRYYVDTPPT